MMILRGVAHEALEIADHLIWAEEWEEWEDEGVVEKSRAVPRRRIYYGK